MGTRKTFIKVIKNRMERRTVLITGGSRGIGAACARAFARKGDKIIVTYRRNKEQASEVIKSLPGEGHSAYPLYLDNQDSIELSLIHI